MSEITIHGPSRLRFTYRSITPEVYSIVPRLRLDMDIHHTVQPPSQPAYPINLSFINSEFRVISKEGTPIYSGILLPNQPFYNLSPASSTSVYLYIDLDHYRLAQIEKIREGKDVSCQVELRFIAEILQQPPIKQGGSTVLNLRIPKSDWIESILPQLRYKDVVLLEVPKIDRPEFGDIVGKINDAWKQHSMGEYDKVLTECRKAMEGLTTLMKEKGFVKEIEEKGEKKIVPDWEKALAHKEMGNIIEVFVQKLFGFLAPGAHYGKSINREDAELAIMCTHAIINFIARKI